MRFEKWQALGNDYLIVEADALPWELSRGRVSWLCDPHFGIGSDGVLLLARSDDAGYVAELRIFNPDGSEAELSGNGAREAILYLRRHGWTEARPSRSSPPPGRSRRRSPRSGPARSRWAGRRRPRRTFPGRPGRQRGAVAGGASGASSTSRSATRSARSRSATGSRTSTWRRSARRSKATGCSRTAPTSLLRGRRQQGAGPDLRARGGGDALLRHRRQRRGGHRLPRAPRARSRSSSTAVSSRSRSPKTSTCG